MPALGSHHRWRHREVGNDEVGNDEAGNAVKKTSAALLAVPLAASMLLAGCGGDSNPDASRSSTASSSPTTTSAPTTSVSPTATVTPTIDPNIPAAARAQTPAGAEAFTKYFFERLNVAWTGPRAGILSPLCQASSKACAAYEKTAARLTKEGHRYDGNPLTMKFIGVLDATNPNKYDVLVNLVQERRREIDAAGKTIVTDKRKTFRVNVELAFTDRAWSVAKMQIMQ